MRKVSVVVPVRNEAPTFRRCLAALGRQTYPRRATETIVVDGGSTDGTRELARAAGHRVLDDDGRGAAAARNVGIAAATGDLVAFTDGDCEPAPDWLAALVARTDREPELAGVGGSLRARPLGTPWSWLEDVSALASYRGFITSNVLYARNVLETVRGFDPRLRCGEDWDLWWRVRDAGFRVAYEPRAVVVHAPEENRSAPAFLAKQFWYARNDVPTFVSRAARTLRRPDGEPKPVLAEPLRVASDAALHGGAAALLLLGLADSRVAAAGLSLLGAWAATRCVLAAPHVAVRDLPRVAVLETLRCLVRGGGTLVGLAEAARAGAVRGGPALARLATRSPRARLTPVEA